MRLLIDVRKPWRPSGRAATCTLNLAVVGIGVCGPLVAWAQWQKITGSEDNVFGWGILEWFAVFAFFVGLISWTQDNVPVPPGFRLKRTRDLLIGYLNCLGLTVLNLAMISVVAYVAARFRLPVVTTGMPVLDEINETLLAIIGNLQHFLGSNEVGLLDMLALLGVAVGVWDVAAGWADPPPSRNPPFSS